MAWTRNCAFFCLLLTGALAVALKRQRQYDSKALEATRSNCKSDQFEWYGGGCASIITTVTDHTPKQADKLCQSQGLHLPSVHSVTESIWIRDTIKKNDWDSVVIGLVPGKCQWFDGTNFDFDYMGTVIDNGWVLTAGHCVYDDMNPKNYQVKAAVFEEDATTESREQISNVKAIHLNPNYDPRTHTYDIALIELATPLKYTDHVQPVCLPTKDTAAIAKHNSAYVTGWGNTIEQGLVSMQLRQVKVPFVDYPTCEKEYPGQIIENTMVCAGAEGLDTCKGDSGGPMVVQGASGRWFQFGIVSWDRGCGKKGETGIYGRVTAFCDFISATTSDKVSCQPIA